MILKLSTPRLILRSVQKTDAPAIFAYRQDETMNQYQGWIPKTLEETEDFLANSTNREINVPGSWHQLVLIDPRTNSVIGDVGMHFIDSTENVEIGCTLDKQFQGQGYAHEALKEVINYLFISLNKHKVKGSIDPRNISSMHMLEKLGFQKEAHVKEAFILRGEYVDDAIYGLLQEEWPANSTK